MPYRSADYIRVEVNRRQLRWALALLFVCASYREIESESIVMTTSYPSPVGIYRTLTTTGPGNTLLARDSNGNLVVGSPTDPDPASRMSIQGNGGAPNLLNVGGTSNGRLRARHIDGKHWASAGFGDLYLQWGVGANTIVNGASGGGLGVGVYPAAKLHVAGDSRVDGNSTINGTQWVAGSQSVAANLGVGQYTYTRNVWLSDVGRWASQVPPYWAACYWQGLAAWSYYAICANGYFQAGMAYEGATWSSLADNHAGPEIWGILCCRL